MPNTQMMRMRPQAPAEYSPMSEPGPISESDWLAQIMMERQKMPQQPTLGSYIANMRSTIDPRHVQALDDFERERARNAMLLSQLQGVR